MFYKKGVLKNLALFTEKHRGVFSTLSNIYDQVLLRNQLSRYLFTPTSTMGCVCANIYDGVCLRDQLSR